MPDNRKPDKAGAKNVKLTDGRKKTLKILALVLIILMLILLALTSFNIASLSSLRDGLKNSFSKMAPGGGYPYQVNSSRVSKVTALNDDVFVLMDDKTVTLDGSAKAINTIEHSFADPGVAISGSRALVFNRNENRYFVQNRTGTLYSGKTGEGEKIITGAIGKKGNIALATLSDKAASRLTVINSTYKDKVFVWNCADYTISSAALSDDGKYAAVSVFGTKGGDSFSKVFVFDFDYADPVSETEFPGTAIVSVNFSNNNNVVAIGDNKTVFLRGLKKPKEIEYGNSTLAAFAYSEAGETILALAEYGSMNSQVLNCYSETGRVSFSKDYTTAVRGVYASNNRVAVLTSNQVDLYSLSGTKFRSRQADSSAISAFVMGNKTYVFRQGAIEKAAKVKS